MTNETVDQTLERLVKEYLAGDSIFFTIPSSYNGLFIGENSYSWNPYVKVKKVPVKKVFLWFKWTEYLEETYVERILTVIGVTGIREWVMPDKEKGEK